MKSNKEVPNTELLLDADKPKINGIFDNGFTNIDPEDKYSEDTTLHLTSNTIPTSIKMEKEPEKKNTATIIAGVAAFIIVAIMVYFLLVK